MKWKSVEERRAYMKAYYHETKSGAKRKREAKPFPERYGLPRVFLDFARMRLS